VLNTPQVFLASNLEEQVDHVFLAGDESDTTNPSKNKQQLQWTVRILVLLKSFVVELPKFELSSLADI